MTLEEFQAISPVFEADIYEGYQHEDLCRKACNLGAPGQEAMKKVIEIYRKRLEEEAVKQKQT